MRAISLANSIVNSVRFIVLAVLLFVSGANLARAENGDDCNPKTVDPDRMIKGCTELLDKWHGPTGRKSDDVVPIFYLFRSQGWQAKGETDRALADIERAIELAPNNSMGYYLRAVIHVDKGEFDRALPDLDKAIVLDPQHAKSFFYRGWAFEKKGDKDRARRDYQKTLELEPGHAEATEGLARLEKSAAGSAADVHVSGSKLHVCGPGTKITAIAALGDFSQETKEFGLASKPASTGDCDVSYVHPTGVVPSDCEDGARITAAGAVRGEEDDEVTLDADTIKCEPLKMLLPQTCQNGSTVRLEGRVREVVREMQRGGTVDPDDPNIIHLQQTYTADDKAYLHLAEPASIKPCPVTVLVFTKGPPPQNCSAGDHVSASGRITAFVGDGGQVNMAMIVDPEPECRK